MIRRLLPLLLVSTFAAGCGDGVTPSLSNFRFVGQAEDSPLVLLLAVDFSDGDGDLGAGSLETFIDDRPTSAGALPLTALFLESDVPLDATSGTLRFVLELAFADDAAEDGASFALGCRATDAAQRSSSTQTVKLTLDL
jgi:hypothetical protein